MATANEQLQKISRELHQVFDNNQYITIKPFDDDPPEKYEVSYHVRGLALTKEGKIAECKKHSIFINIPFGFPHFPPSCTPQTQTFHPDFDQAAICIGEFWNKERSLSELIIHIGMMIVGEYYSTENAFNEKAAQWYQKNASRLPFQKVSFPKLPDKSDPSSQTGQEYFDLTDDDLLSGEIDMLGEDDLIEKNDFFGGSATTGSSPKKQVSASGKSIINRVRLLYQQQRYYELSSCLKELSPDDRFEDRKKIEEDTLDRIAEAKKISEQADTLEHEGDSEAALALYQQVQELVQDYPEVEDNIARTKQSVDLSEDWSTDTEEYVEPVPSSAAAKDSVTAPQKRVKYFEETTKASIRFLPILAIIIVVILAFAFVTPYMKANSRLKEAEASYMQCQDYLSQDNYVRAKQACENAEEFLDKLSFFKKNAGRNLHRQIEQTMTSPKMTQGLAGKVMFEGKYISKDDKEKVLAFSQFKEEADKLFSQSLWKNALTKYNAALENASSIGASIDPEILAETRQKAAVSEISLLAERGQALLDRGELERAAEVFTEASQKSDKLSEETGGPILGSLQPILDKIKYLEHLNLGKKYFYSNDWESAVEQYEEALKLQSFSDNELAPSDDANALYANMAEAELFSLINSAKEAFSQSKYDQAIKDYDQAIKLIDQKKKLLSRISPDEIAQQLRRIKLRARIVQLKQTADKQMADGNFEQTISALNQVVEAITTSGFANDREFSAIISGTKSTIQTTRNKAQIEKRIAYLSKNYKELFSKNYSAAIPEYLSQPKATFLRNVDGKELYELQCLETNMGRKLRLVMLYSYDPATGNWQFYSNAQ